MGGGASASAIIGYRGPSTAAKTDFLYKVSGGYIQNLGKGGGGKIPHSLKIPFFLQIQQFLNQTGEFETDSGVIELSSFFHRL